MQDVSILGCQGKKAIGKEFLLALEIAILKSSFFSYRLPVPKLTLG